MHKNLVKFGRAVFEFCKRRTDRQTDALITILRAPHGGEVIKDAADGDDSVTDSDREAADLPHLSFEAVATLASIAGHSRSLYAPYAEQVFEKACSNIEGIKTIRYLGIM